MRGLLIALPVLLFTSIVTAAIVIPHLTVFEPGDNPGVQFGLVPDQGNGRVIHCQAGALGPKWSDGFLAKERVSFSLPPGALPDARIVRVEVR